MQEEQSIAFPFYLLVLSIQITKLILAMLLWRLLTYYFGMFAGILLYLKPNRVQHVNEFVDCRNKMMIRNCLEASRKQGIIEFYMFK